jgi:capsular polysaccharide transport system ATP-binding protein
MISCERVTKSYPMGKGRKEVLKGIDLRVEAGARVGFLGRNGAGKTTLIKLIGGVEMPTSGKIKRERSVSWPIGFGGGFHGSLTGYDNARFIARIYSHSYNEIRDFVEDFSELGPQLKMPVKTYSSGMRARLAFALSLAIEFDCYLIDEVIMVGDANFQKKCHHELFDKRRDRALIIASHSYDIVREYCDCALVLDDGHGTIFTDVNDALRIYSNL